MNRLAQEASPYLRQHAENPVDWYPWGEEAFELARREDKPILLSVGYSACHWCHVMAHESFEDPATAEVMNRLFVNVKVDREERPDVDAIYMDAVQAMAGSGGWPMTVFLFPDGRPFFGGTYFPPRRTHGRPAFTELMTAVDQAWREGRDGLEEQAGQLTKVILAKASGDDEEGEVSSALLDGAYRVLKAAHDDSWGGFGGAPKFPQPTFAELLLRAHARNGSDVTLAMVRRTLDAMAAGGIYDHVGGGFARYAVDNTWTVPHFEKMLYDEAGLLRLYVHGWQVTGDARYRQVVEEIVAYVLRDLWIDGGGIASAEDADSEGVEGKFYVWSLDEVRSIAGQAAVDWYGVSEHGNFEGANILRRAVGDELVRPPTVEAGRAALFEVRSTRVRPGLDDKVLTEWNAMFLSALAEAGAALGRADWLARARELAELLLTNLRVDGRWRRAWQTTSGARHLAYAADHAWLVDAFTRLAEATGEARWIAEARAAASELMTRFDDAETGAFFTTADDAETLIARQRDTYDGASPSANGTAAVALVRLGALTGDAALSARGEAVLRFLAGAMGSQPAAHTHALAGVDMVVHGIDEIAVVGDLPELVTAVQARYLPAAVLAWGEPFGGPLWESRDAGKAYVCRDYACQQPVTTVDALLAQLQQQQPKRT